MLATLPLLIKRTLVLPGLVCSEAINIDVRESVRGVESRFEMS